MICLVILVVLSYIVTTYETSEIQSEIRHAYQSAQSKFATVANKTKTGSVADLFTSINQEFQYVQKEISKTDLNNFENKILVTSQHGEPLIRFALTFIISLGAMLKLVYQTYGMTGLPIFLIKGTKSLEDENDEIKGTISSVREELRRIQEKYARNNKSHLTAKDKALLKKLRKEEKILSKKQLQITN